MPTKASKSLRNRPQEAVEEHTSPQITDEHSYIEPDKSAEDCSCLCKTHQDSDEWEVDNEELLHVEINGIFQVRYQKKYYI